MTNSLARNNLACNLFRRCLDSDEPRVQFQKNFGVYLKRVVWRTVRRHGARLQNHEVEELVQELVYRLLAGGQPEILDWSDRQLWAYLSRIASSLLVDRHRHRQRRSQWFTLARGRAGLEWLTDQPRTEAMPTPEDLVLRQDICRRLKDLMDQIVRPDQRSLELRGLRMALLEGYSSREIARLTDGRLKSRRVDRLVFRLRRKLAAAGLGQPPRRFTSRHDLRTSSNQGARILRRRAK